MAEDKRISELDRHETPEGSDLVHVLHMNDDGVYENRISTVAEIASWKPPGTPPRVIVVGLIAAAIGAASIEALQWLTHPAPAFAAHMLTR